MANASVFGYGTLRFPAVLRALLGRIPERSSAQVTGWRAARLPDQVFPALVAADAQTAGSLLTGLTPLEWRIIDEWEDDFYDLHELVLDDGRTACAYVCHDSSETLRETWDPEDFQRRDLESFLTRCREWRCWYEHRSR
jgi:hypothetical protein